MFYATISVTSVTLLLWRSSLRHPYSGYFKQKEKITWYWNLTQIPRKSWTFRLWAGRNRQLWESREQLFISSSLCPRFLFLKVWPRLRSVPTPWSWEGKIPSTWYQFDALGVGWCPQKKWKDTVQEKITNTPYLMYSTQMFSNACLCLW